MLEIYLDHKGPQEGLNREPLSYEVVIRLGYYLVSKIFVVHTFLWVVTEICDPNKFWAWHHRSLTPSSKLKHLNIYKLIYDSQKQINAKQTD